MQIIIIKHDDPKVAESIANRAIEKADGEFVIVKSTKRNVTRTLQETTATTPIEPPKQKGWLSRLFGNRS